MSVVISDEVLQSAHISGDELLQELALMLYERGRLTLGQASQLADVSQLQFQFLLASRHIPLHYDVKEFEADLKTLRETGQL
jgi:predicted HTH domain antitoxin